MLSVEGLDLHYGDAQALAGVTLDVPQGAIVAIVGANGAGKTSLIRAISGMLKPSAGRIRFKGADITGQPSHRVCNLGLGQVAEGRQVFPTLSVRENLIATAADRFHRANPWTLARVFGLFPRLEERADQMAATLSGGEQQMLAIGRALMTNPHVLILDEATEGLAPLIRAEIWACLALLKQEGHAILIIDKALSALQPLADRHFILEKGVTVWTGTSADVIRDREKVNGWIGL
jgi:branched-chain amino acid transport system ATP-binding protein